MVEPFTVRREVGRRALSLPQEGARVMALERRAPAKIAHKSLSSKERGKVFCGPFVVHFHRGFPSSSLTPRSGTGIIRRFGPRRILPALSFPSKLGAHVVQHVQR